MTVTKSLFTILIALLFCTSVEASHRKHELQHILAPWADWLNPHDSSMLEFTVLSEIETEGSQTINLLIGLPFAPSTTPGVYLKTASSSCDLEDADLTSARVEAADETLIRTVQDGLTYYWVSAESLTYEPESYITVALSIDLSAGSAGFNDPIDVALTTSTDQYYMILSQNTHVLPLYILSAPATFTVTGSTADVVDVSLGSSFTGLLEFTTTSESRRFVIELSGFDVAADYADYLEIKYTTDAETVIDEDEYESELDEDGCLTIRLVDETVGAYFGAESYTVSVRIEAPDSPATASVDIYTMDKYGPNIIETGSASSLWTTTSEGWSSGYPKVKFSYGFDAGDDSVKGSYGLYSVGGTSMVYNHLVFFFKQSTYDFPSGAQTLTITVGSTSVPATVATGTLQHNLVASGDGAVTIEASASSITVSGFSLSKGTEGKIAVKIAYEAADAAIASFGLTVLKVSGTTVFSGSPDLRDGFSTPIQNKSPVGAGLWAEYVSSAFGSRVGPADPLTSADIESDLPLTDGGNGLRVDDDQYLYMYSRVGPYTYFVGDTQIDSGDHSLMFLELTVPSSISAEWDDTDQSNGVFYLAEHSMLAAELERPFYLDDSGDGWLYMGVERMLCDTDFDGTADVDERYCVDWYCFEDADGDGSYDSPQPCKPVRACDSTSPDRYSLWYPEVEGALTQNFDSAGDKDEATSMGFDFGSDSVQSWAASDGSLVPGSHLMGKECRPVRECDSTDADNGEGVYMITHTTGEDCVRGSLPYCTAASNPDSGALDEDADGDPTTCETVQACDYDSAVSGGSLNKRVDGQYCNPQTTETPCDEYDGSLTYTSTHGASLSAGGDCVSLPLCDVETGGVSVWDGSDDLTMLAFSGSSDDCIRVASGDVCTTWYGEANAANQMSTLLQYPGWAATSADGTVTDCAFMPYCDKGFDADLDDGVGDQTWFAEERIDGKTCTLSVPICFHGRHQWQVNSGTALYYLGSPGIADAYSDFATLSEFAAKGLEVVEATPREPRTHCIVLEACDTFEAGTSLLRSNSEGKACIKMVSRDGLSIADSDNLFLNHYGGSADLSQFQLIDFGSSSNSRNVNRGRCNAVDDDGMEVYKGLWGVETDCVPASVSSCDISLQRLTSWGIVQELSTDSVLPAARGLIGGCIWQIPCTRRGDDKVSGNLVEQPTGENCLTIENADLCTSLPDSVASHARTSTDFSIFLGSTDESCIITPTCYLNAFIQGSQYYTHAGARDGIVALARSAAQNLALRLSFPHWGTYGLKDQNRWLTEACWITESSSTVDYLSPDDLDAAFLIQFAYDNDFQNEARRLDVDYGEDMNFLNIPEDLLFFEDVYSDTFDTFNPIRAVAFATESLYNTIKVQLEDITVEYYKAPVGDTETLSSFTLQTWNLVFLDPPDGSDMSMHNIFAFQGVSILLVNKLSADYDDFNVQDLFWAVYFNADSSDIEQPLEDLPDIYGLENLVVYSPEENGGEEYLSEDEIFWTTYAHSGNTGSSYFPNVFMLFGNSLGTQVTLSTASTLVIFFDGVSAVSDVDDEVSCSSLGITVSNCAFSSNLGTTSASVEYYTTSTASTTSAMVYAPLFRSKVEIELEDTGEASWSIIFPFEEGDTSTVNYLPIGLMDSEHQLQYLSGRSNGNEFNQGDTLKTNRAFYYVSAGADAISDTVADPDDVLSLYEEGTDTLSSSFDTYSWLDLGDEEKEVGETIASVVLNWVNDAGSEGAQRGFHGVMLCLPYNFLGTNYAASPEEAIPSDPNFYGCWDPIEYGDGYCQLCNIDGETGTFGLPFEITISDFVLPDDKGLAFPSGSRTISFNEFGEAVSIVNLSDAGDPWLASPLTFTGDTTFIRGESSRLSLGLSTAYGIPSGSTITLEVLADEGGNDISLPGSSNDICYVDDMETACTFSWSSSAISIVLGNEVEAGSFTVYLYGLWADEETDLETDQNYMKLYGDVTVSSGGVLYESEADTYLKVTYTTASSEVSISELSLSVDNFGWNSVLMAKISTKTKKIYDGEYFALVFSSVLSQEGNPECNIWDEDWQSSGYVSTCDIVSLEDITVTPWVDSVNGLDSFEFYITLNDIIVPTSFSGATLTVYQMYNGGETSLTSSSMVLPSPYTSASDISDLAVAITHDYVGVASTLTYTFTSPVDIEESESILLAFSSNYGYTLANYELWVTVNDDMVWAERNSFNEIELVGLPKISALDEVTIVVDGISSPNIASSEERTFYLGVYSYIVTSSSSDDWQDNTLSASGTYSTTADPADLSSVDLLYPRFLELGSSSSRTDTYITFDFESPASLAIGTMFEFRLHAVDIAIERVGTPSCSLKDSSNVEYSQSCAIENNVVSFSLKTALTLDETYTVRLSNIPNPDWMTCSPDLFQVEVWFGETLSAISAPGLNDSMDFDIEGPNADDYSVEVDGIEDRFSFIELPIGFLSEILIVPSTERFAEDLELSAEEDGLVSQIETTDTAYWGYTGSAMCGYESASLIVSVSEDAYETSGHLLINVGEEAEIARAPVVTYELYEMTSSLTVNGNLNIYVENGLTGSPVSICVDDVPAADHVFTLWIEGDNSESDPEFSLDVATLTLGPQKVCDFIWITAAETKKVEDGSTATLYIEAEDHFDSISTTVTLQADTNSFKSTDSLEIYYSESVTAYTATFTISTNKRSLVVLYVAPEAHYLVEDDWVFEDVASLVGYADRILSPETNILAETFIDTELTFDLSGLLRGIEYQVKIFAIGQDEEFASSEKMSFTTSDDSGEVRGDAVYYEVELDGLYEDEDIETFICSVAQIYSIPFEDVSSIDGENCYEPIDWSSGEWALSEVFSDMSSSDQTGSSDGGSSGSDFGSSSSSDASASSERMLQASSSSTSSMDSMSQSSSSVDVSSDEVADTTTVGLYILPPIRSWVPEYDDDETTFSELLDEWFSEDIYVINSVVRMDNLPIEAADSVSYSSTSVTEYTITISEVSILGSEGEAVDGSLCYALFEGTEEATVSSINSASGAVESGCWYISSGSSEELVFEGLTPETDYTLGLYGQSVDNRELSKTTDATSLSLATEALAVTEEEEYGFISSVGFLALLVALFFNF